MVSPLNKTTYGEVFVKIILSSKISRTFTAASRKSNNAVCVKTCAKQRFHITSVTVNLTYHMHVYLFTFVPAKSDRDVILCLQLLSKNNLYTLLDVTRIDRSLVY